MPDRSTALEMFRTAKSGHSHVNASIAVTVNLTALDETEPTQEMGATKAEPTGQRADADGGSAVLHQRHPGRRETFTGSWDDAECMTHHRDARAQCFHLTLDSKTAAFVRLTGSGALSVSN